MIRNCKLKNVSVAIFLFMKCCAIHADLAGEEWLILKNAIRSGDEKLIKEKISEIKNIEEIILNGSPLLVYVVRNGSEKSTRIAVERGVKVDAKDGDGNTALHWACRLSKDKIAKLLYENGAKIDSLNARGQSPIHVAVSRNALNVLRSLAEAGANLNVKDVRLRSPFFDLDFNGGRETAKVLLELGMDPLLPDDNGILPIHMLATSAKSYDVVKLLVEKSPESINARDRWRESPIFRSVFTSQKEVAELLVSCKAKLTFENIHGETVLHIAARMSGPDMIELLVRGGAAIEARNNKGLTPLHIAATLFHFENVKSLLKFGAKANVEIKGRDLVSIVEGIQVVDSERLSFAKLETIKILKEALKAHPQEREAQKHP